MCVHMKHSSAVSNPTQRSGNKFGFADSNELPATCLKQCTVLRREFSIRLQVAETVLETSLCDRTRNWPDRQRNHGYAEAESKIQTQRRHRSPRMFARHRTRGVNHVVMGLFLGAAGYFLRRPPKGDMGACTDSHRPGDGLNWQSFSVARLLGRVVSRPSRQNGCKEAEAITRKVSYVQAHVVYLLPKQACLHSWPVLACPGL